LEQTPSPSKELIVGDCLRRVAEQSEGFCATGDFPLENLIVMGASAGGHTALKTVVRGLSHDIPAALIIMQHMPATGATVLKPFKLENWLRESTQIATQVIQSGDRLQRGRIYITPPGHSVYLDGRMLQLQPQTQALPVTTINTLFQSAAQQYKERVIGVVLTGLLCDGTAGLRAVHEAGGLTIVQDPAEAEYPDMPANAMRGLPVTFCLRSSDIGLALDVLARRHTTLETGLAHSTRMLKERAALLLRLLMQSKGSPTTSQFLSSEIHALARDLQEVRTLLDEARTVSSSLGGDEVSGKVPL